MEVGRGVEKRASGIDAAGGDCPGDGKGDLALGGTEVAVARRQGETIGIAHNRTSVDADREMQIIHHLADQRELLVILLAEERVASSREREQLRHHREHAREVCRAGRALQHLTQRARLDRRARAVGVHRLSRRREHSLDALRFQLLYVLGERTRVGVQVLARRELQRVDEDAHHHRVAQRLCLLDQSEVALMQRPHRRHQGNRAVADGVGEGLRGVDQMCHVDDYGTCQAITGISAGAR